VPEPDYSLIIPEVKNSNPLEIIPKKDGTGMWYVQWHFAPEKPLYRKKSVDNRTESIIESKSLYEQWLEDPLNM